MKRNKKKIYKVEVHESQDIVLDVEANSREDAYQRVKKMYEDGNIPNEYIEYNYEINVL